MKDNLIADFWRRNQPNAPTDTSAWTDELATLYKSGISLEAALAFLYRQKPSLAEFENWVDENRIIIDDDSKIMGNVLSEDDLGFWEQNGYIVVKNVISRPDCESTCKAIWDFLGKSEEDVASWYVTHAEKSGMMVNFSNHPTLNKNRTSPKIRKAYEQLYQTDKIYKTIDKVSFNPPVYQNHSFRGSGLHWDVSLKLPIPFRLQGLIYLSDCDENDGAFHCVPGFQNQIEDWMARLPEKTDIRQFALQTLRPIPVTGQAGDLVIWHQALPHCATPNFGKLPRMVQYISYFPDDYKPEEEWI